MCGKDGLAGSPLSINTWASPSGKHYAPAGLTSTAMPSRIVRHVTHGPLQAAVRGFKPPATNTELSQASSDLCLGAGQSIMISLWRNYLK